MVTANSFTCTLFFTNAYVLNTVSRESQSNGSHKELQINANNQFALWSSDCVFSFVVLAQLQLRAHLQVDRDELACWTKRRAEQAPNRRLSCSTTKKKSKKSKSKSNRKKVKWSEKDLLTSLGNYQSTKCISLNHSSQNIRWKTTFTKSTQSALQLFGFKLIICFIKKKKFHEWMKKAFNWKRKTHLNFGSTFFCILFKKLIRNSDFSFSLQTTFFSVMLWLFVCYELWIIRFWVF